MDAPQDEPTARQTEGIAMSLYIDICTEGTCLDEEISFDEASGTWTLTSWQADGEPIPGFPTRSMAEAVGRALDVAYHKGGDTSQYS
jgi:hypothetical protein